MLLKKFQKINKIKTNHIFFNNITTFNLCSSTIESKNPPKPIITLTFKYLSDNSEVKIRTEIGNNILKVAHNNNIDLEGACDCSLACSTCHVILDEDIYNKLPPADEVEDDLLDLAFALTHTSRLGCQIILTEDFDGRIIKIPSATKNLYVDGHKPTPH
jgi:ferredoxin